MAGPIAPTDPELFWVELEAPAPAWRLCGALVKKEEYEGSQLGCVVLPWWPCPPHRG